MIRMLIPAALGLVAIVSLSFYEGYAMKDRWSEPGIEAGELGERFALVPNVIGDWEGKDKPVEEVVRKTAGAVGYVSRVYTNLSTGKQVDLWLIVGHSRDITRHTPDICYPSQGFRQVTNRPIRHAVKTSDDKETMFYTAKYEKVGELSHSIDRVFWTFNHPDKNQWDAPEEGARMHYGLAKALYKLYFTSTVSANEDGLEDSVAIEFAELMLPAIDAALFPTAATAAESSSTESSSTGDAITPTSETDEAI